MDGSDTRCFFTGSGNSGALGASDSRVLSCRKKPAGGNGSSSSKVSASSFENSLLIEGRGSSSPAEGPGKVLVSTAFSSDRLLVLLSPLSFAVSVASDSVVDCALPAEILPRPALEARILRIPHALQYRLLSSKRHCVVLSVPHSAHTLFSTTFFLPRLSLCITVSLPFCDRLAKFALCRTSEGDRDPESALSQLAVTIAHFIKVSSGEGSEEGKGGRRRGDV
mmetsp:Transcript_13045/g.40186  ORF Transcript_13045/g.40186 Transcript_13045/m.40186 type:complete len:223 (-) Transcript_13045:392-1060(-)